jgi:hypothetical protein
MPIRVPVNTSPTTLPRSFGAASEAAIGTTICTAAVQTPIRRLMNPAARISRVAVMAIRTTPNASSSVTTRRLRSSMSPRGTMKRMPSAMPHWLSAGRKPTPAAEVPNDAPIWARIGCA